MTMIERHVDTNRHAPDRCWPYPGYVNRTTGYGGCQWRGGRYEAHRAAYEMLVGPIPDGLHIDHLCRNRACCNPAHMEPVPARVNVLRGESPAARQARQTACVHGHPLDGDNVWIDQRGRRHCVECRRLRSRSYYYARTGDREAPPLRADRATHCHVGHEWTPENTGRSTTGVRVCRACMRDHQRRYRAARKAHHQSAASEIDPPTDSARL